MTGFALLCVGLLGVYVGILVHSRRRSALPEVWRQYQAANLGNALALAILLGGMGLFLWLVLTAKP